MLLLFLCERCYIFFPCRYMHDLGKPPACMIRKWVRGGDRENTELQFGVCDILDAGRIEDPIRVHLTVFYCSGNCFFEKKLTFVFLNFESENTVYRTGNCIPLSSGISKITDNRRFTGGKVNPDPNSGTLRTLSWCVFSRRKTSQSSRVVHTIPKFSMSKNLLPMYAWGWLQQGHAKAFCLSNWHCSHAVSLPPDEPNPEGKLPSRREER